MRQMAAYLYTFLRRYNINTDKVKLILRADNDEIAYEIKCGIMLDVGPLIEQVIEPYKLDPANFKLNGISISVTSLDHSR